MAEQAMVFVVKTEFGGRKIGDVIDAKDVDAVLKSECAGHVIRTMRDVSEPDSKPSDHATEG